MASAIAHRLSVCHFSVVMTEIPFPTVIRREVSFAQAVFSGEMTVEGVRAILVQKEKVREVLDRGHIALLIDPKAEIIDSLKPDVVVDAILAKRNLGTRITEAPLVVAVGPGFKAGEDVHYCIETMRGHHLGRVITQGSALPDTGIPGEIGGHTKERVLRAPRQGILKSKKSIGERVDKNEIIGYIDSEPISATLSGVLRGIVQDGCVCDAGMKIGDIDPRGMPEYCRQISDKARSVAGGVLEAVVRSSIVQAVGRK